MAVEGPMPSPSAGADTRLTYDDLQHMPDDGLRHELIDGVHYVTASPNVRHQIVLGRLHVEVRVEIFRRAPDNRLARAVELDAERADVLTTPLLPGFSLALPDLFREGL